MRILKVYKMVLQSLGLEMLWTDNEKLHINSSQRKILGNQVFKF